MIINGECLEELKKMENNSVDSIVTDPPYEIGFMNKGWDNTGIAYSVELWSECLRVLKPGGHLLAFSASRTYHRMTCAIEDAGFEIRDMIEWIYGSGFPKSNNISKSIDKMKGAKREVIGKNPKCLPYKEGHTPEAEQWDGWGTGLKPAHEPIVMARKPIEESPIAKSVLKYGTGAINIDGCRVGVDGTEDRSRDNSKVDVSKQFFKGFREMNQQIPIDLGRFPANLIHDGSECVEEMFPITKTGDSGSAARFFKCCPNDTEDSNVAKFIYCAKSSMSERNIGCDDLEEKVVNIHPTIKPVKLMQYLCKLVTPPNGIVLDPFMGSGSTGMGAKLEGFNFIGIEREQEYCDIAERRIKATTKPITIMEI